jgi:L-lactate dehydrogenase complex protein LldG
MKLPEYLEQIPVYTVPIPTGNSSEEAIGKDVRIQCENADIGITGVDFAIAETGSCVLVTRPGVGRLESLLPPVHIAVVCSGQVLSSLDELFAVRRMAHLTGEGEGYMSIITGPSRTADIQQKLITGVHGPIHVHMILVQ